ncbi:DNA-binding response OmpR family regulator [Inquilinus ginsengisoli]|jgi:DNA-binding response OmpR family regulator|uniref:response regulator n=1 Tax=Inquilinus TaxID=171673 RepID=UPI003D1DCE03
MESREPPPRVLIVEDDTWIAAMLEDIALSAGLEVVGPVSTLREAVRIASSERLDAAILDIGLGRTEVYAAADVLDERGIPFAFVTGRSESEIELLHRGRPVWTKPFLQQQIANGLKDLIARR